MNVKSNFITIALSVFGLSGCGGSSSQTDVGVDLYTGVFIDSAVEGLNFRTMTQQGITNMAGEFTYQLGEDITFSIGGIEFPTTGAISQVTPLTVFNTEDLDDVRVINMLRLLQTLDSDGLADNGITISASAHALLASTAIEFSDENFDSVINTVLSSYSGVNTSLISANVAVSHFIESIDDATSGCSTDHPLVGAQADFQSYNHDVSGSVTVIDNCTLKVENFTYDATAPAVYFYADTSDDFESANAFILGDQLRDNSNAYNNETITITLPANKSLSDIQYLSVWCVDFSVNFGDLRFELP